MARLGEMRLFYSIFIGVFIVMCNEKLDMDIDIKKVPMVRLTWRDARDTETGWLDIKDVINAPLAVCQEVGWMIHNNEEKIIIMRSYSKDKEEISGGGAIAIPKSWVIKIEYLEVSYGERSSNQ
jgi:hypothetical protein